LNLKRLLQLLLHIALFALAMVLLGRVLIAR